MEEKDLLQNSCGGFPYPVTTQGELESFSCGDKDLDDFFHQDAFLYAEQLLGKTYGLVLGVEDAKPYALLLGVGLFSTIFLALFADNILKKKND